ncbi:MAG: ABC transporter permease [Terrimicrobiaceae bacterium]|nr:ABC transporter permease [Terrimicrobiaceae bacterium]
MNQMPIESREDASYWTTVITPQNNLFHIPWKELWEYRELIFRFVHRDFVSRYKQTVLGSFWYVIQPLLTSLMFTIIFGKIAKIPTGSIPPMLFFLAGTVCWSYFNNCVANTASTFNSNSGLFDKVYFPRLSVPLSQLVVNLIGFGMQLVMFLGFLAWFAWQGAPVRVDWRVIVLPVLILEMAAFGLGVGCIVSAVTTRFRDLQIMLGFFLQLWMYASCVIYPLAVVPPEYQWILALNPMVLVIEAFRYAFLGEGTVYLWQIVVSFFISIVVVFIGLAMFNKTQRSCVDIL